MDLTPYIEGLQNDLVTAAAPGGAETARAAEVLGGALAASARLALLEAISDAAAEITAQLSSASVEVRLKGREADLVVTEAAPAEQPAPAAPAVNLEGDLTRLTLRMPEPLKEQVEASAAAEGVSVNQWLVRAVATAIGRPPVPAPPVVTGKRISGYAQA